MCTREGEARLQGAGLKPACTHGRVKTHVPVSHASVKEEEDYEKKKKPTRREEARQEGDGPYMRFDFRRGRMRWPENAELIDPAKGTEMTDEARKEVSLRPFHP